MTDQQGRLRCETSYLDVGDLEKRPDAPVLFVQTESSYHAAQQIAGKTYVVLVCGNELASQQENLWGLLKSRQILLWANRNSEGRQRVLKWARILEGHCKQIKMLLPQGEDGWNATDALQEGMDYEKLKGWARSIIRVHSCKPTQVNIDKAVIMSPQVNINEPEGDYGDVSESNYSLWTKAGVALTDRGLPICNMDNVKRLFEGLPLFQDFAYFDDFYDRVFIKWKSEQPRELTDQVVINIMGYLQRQLGFRRITKDHVYQAIVDYAFERHRNEPKDWFKTLVWDDVPRIESFFIKYFGAEDNEYTRAAGKNFWIAMVARVCEPGCKFDHLVYLQGAQGAGKTTAWEIVGGNWYTSANYGLADKEFLPALRGKMIVELSELTSIKKGDINHIKEIITRRVDNYRTPYDRLSKDHPRQCVFVGSTNSDLVIPDNSGARRFWRIRCQGGSVRTDLIKSEREQLFAEAVHRHKAKEPWWIMPEAITREIQEELRNADVWEDKIQDYLIGKGAVTSAEVLTDCLGKPIGSTNQQDKNRVSSVMKLLGWKNKPEWVDGRSVRVWRPYDCDGVMS